MTPYLSRFRVITAGCAVTLLAGLLNTQAAVTITTATGGNNISADTAANSPAPAWTTLGRIAIAEPGNSQGDFGSSGTLVLKAPAGFVFNTAVLPNISFTNGRDIQSADIVFTDATTITITLVVNGTSRTDTLNIGNSTALQVRPSAGTPLAGGVIYRPVTGGGTAVINNIIRSSQPDGSGGTSFGSLSSIPGSSHQLSLQVAPPAAATAGQILSPSPVVQIVDQFGNVRTGDNSSVVAARLLSGATGLTGTTNVTATGGIATFSNLSIRKAGTVAITFTNAAVDSVSSGSILVSPAAATTLAFSTSPGTSVYGSPLSPQPVVKTQDAYGNDSTLGLPASVSVTLTLSSGTGSLIGTAVSDIGTSAGNGVAFFSGLRVSAAGPGKRLTASASGFGGVQSVEFSVMPATLAGSVTVANKVYDATTSAVILTRTLVGVLEPDAVTLTGGTANFENKNVGTNKLVTVTGLILGGTDASNYQLASSTVSASASITKTVLTVSAGNQSRPYGGANAFTASYSGFPGGETLATSDVTGTPQFTSTATATSSPGDYPLTVSAGTLSSSNYNFNFVAGQLTITKAPLLVGADSKWKTLGASNPALTYSFSGLVNGETAAVISGTPSLSTTATTGSPVGEYPISLALGSLSSANYSFTPVNGVLTVVPAGTLFYDGFSRLGNPGALSPWLVQTGAWSIVSGTLLGGTNQSNRYSQLYLTNIWNDYTVEAQFTFPAAAYGAALAGRLDRNTGRRYAVWIYPESSESGFSNIVRLVKFNDWTTFSYRTNAGAAMAQTSIASVSTVPHSLKLVFNGPNIGVYLDGQRLISTTDVEPTPLLQGGIDLEMWTGSSGYQFQADNVRVTSWSGPVASNDSYNTTAGSLFTVSAPGVLSNDLAAGTNVTAVLVSGAANGTVTLSTNGGFTYTSPASVGTDQFTYRVNDGSAQSGIATVTLNILANTPPTALADNFAVQQNTALVVNAPGVLANDSDPDPQTLAAQLIAPPAVGTLVLATNGGFNYYPPYDYTGPASFTYRAFDGAGYSSTVTVSINITAASTLFSENFTRTNDPGSLLPWQAHSGTWTVTGGLLRGDTTLNSTYSQAHTTNTWTDFIAETRIQFPAGSYGGGLGVRLNPANGQQYAAWIYPEGSPGGSGVLKLLKFTSWTTFATVRQVPLPAVGTSWHNLKLVCYERRIAVYFDGRQLVNIVDSDAQAYESGGLCLQFWTETTPYQPLFDDVLVQPWQGPTSSNDVFAVTMNTPLVVPAPGIFANDLAAGTNLTATLITPPTLGNLVLNPTGGGFTYTPNPSYMGTDTFIYQLHDGLEAAPAATVTLNIGANSAPVAANDSYSVTAYSVLSLGAPGVLSNDTDPDGQPLKAFLVAGPSTGALTLATNGAVTYVPPAGFTGVANFTYQATDGISTSTTATVTITVTPATTPYLTDDFVRPDDPGSLSPWVLRSGNWAVTGGALRAGTNSSSSYGYVYSTGQWTDFAVEAKIRFEAGAYGGGLGGRLNPANGAHYAAWLYPAGSPGGSDVLKLIKFQNWNAFAYTNVTYIPMRAVSVPSIGTAWHTLKLQFIGNQIVVSYDGAPVISMADAELQTYSHGAVSLEMWTEATGYRMFCDDVIVSTAGSLPTPVTASIALLGSSVQLSFTGAPNTQYIVQSAPSLVPPVTWTPISTNTSAADGKWTNSAPASAPQRFYRAFQP